MQRVWLTIRDTLTSLMHTLVPCSRLQMVCIQRSFPSDKGPLGWFDFVYLLISRGFRLGTRVRFAPVEAWE